jgi:hypothetical protein
MELQVQREIQGDEVTAGEKFHEKLEGMLVTPLFHINSHFVRASEVHTTAVFRNCSLQIY